MSKLQPLIGRFRHFVNNLGQRRPVRPASRQPEQPFPRPDTTGPRSAGLEEIVAFGANPGKLRLWVHVPQHLPPAAPLVVVLHGCGQTAQGFVTGTGWSKLADRLGFVVALPEQRRENNAHTCFNWFQPADVTRDQGEVGSIRQMVEHVVVTHGLDRRRIFVTGLSAGGATAASLLAVYPDIFAAGAVVAGLAHGSAASVNEALGAMMAPGSPAAQELGERVRRASSHGGPWPRIAIWHGSSDHIVRPANGEAIIRQWTNVHGLPGQHGAEDRVDGNRRRLWLDARGRSVIEATVIDGLGHGVPVAAAKGGMPTSYILEAGTHSTDHIARFFGLAPVEAGTQR